jgi:hypothetical protein
MPGTAVKLGAAQQVLPLHRIVEEVLSGQRVGVVKAAG